MFCVMRDFCIQQGNFPEFSHVRKYNFSPLLKLIVKWIKRLIGSFYNHQKVSVQSFSYVPKSFSDYLNLSGYSSPAFPPTKLSYLEFLFKIINTSDSRCVPLPFILSGQVSPGIFIVRPTIVFLNPRVVVSTSGSSGIK